jgi:hypothetical protein
VNLARPAILFGVGLVAIGLVRHPGAADAALQPADDHVRHNDISVPGISLLIRVPPVHEARLPARSEDDDTEEVDDAGTSSEAPAVAGSRDYRWTAADVLYMRDRASSRARCVVDREIGGFGYDPWRRGAQGERGPVQLHPRGLLPEYLAWSGGQAPENPYYAIPFLEYKLRQGQGRHWSPVRLGMC